MKERDLKMLWGRAGNRCSFPTCRRELSFGEDGGEAAVIGEAAHIVGEKLGAARWSPDLTDAQRNAYGNRLLVCGADHKTIDDQPKKYTVKRLQEMKATHEQWVRQSLGGFDAGKQNDDEFYAGVMDEWSRRANLENWTAWSSYVLGGGNPRISKKMDKRLADLRIWLLNRIWSRRYRKLEAAFENFRRVLNDFQETLHEDYEEQAEYIAVEKFYKIEEWDPPRYERLSKLYESRVALVQDLMLELTRAANYVCDRFRQFINPKYRLKEGNLLIEWGPDMSLTWRSRVVRYVDKERVLMPYKDLESFKKMRSARDLTFSLASDVT